MLGALCIFSRIAFIITAMRQVLWEMTWKNEISAWFGASSLVHLELCTWWVGSLKTPLFKGLSAPVWCTNLLWVSTLRPGYISARGGVRWHCCFPEAGSSLIEEQMSLCQSDGEAWWWAALWTSVTVSPKGSQMSLWPASHCHMLLVHVDQVALSGSSLTKCTEGPQGLRRRVRGLRQIRAGRVFKNPFLYINTLSLHMHIRD